jgi:hypothetical protein
MRYPHPKHQIDELVRAAKVLRDGEKLDVESRGETGGTFAVNLDLVAGAFIDLRYLGKAADFKTPHSYEANLIIAGHRVRGVGHCNVRRNNLRAKLRIPAGWHQNHCDPNRSTFHPEFNRHEPLPDFLPTDFSDFITRCAGFWTIDLGTEEPLL